MTNPGFAYYLLNKSASVWIVTSFQHVSSAQSTLTIEHFSPLSFQMMYICTAGLKSILIILFLFQPSHNILLGREVFELCKLWKRWWKTACGVRHTLGSNHTSKVLYHEPWQCSYKISSLEKTAHISQHHQEERAQKLHTDDVLLPRSG